MTLGVRGLVLDGAGRVFLVRHTYVSGWHLPGGGVEVGETVAQALARELREEGNIEIEGEPRLLGLYLNLAAGQRDHVAVYVVRTFLQVALRPPDVEIAEAGFFPLGALPDGVTRGAQARILEVAGDAAVSAYW